MLDFYLESEEVKKFVKASRMSENAKMLVMRLLGKEEERILKDKRVADERDEGLDDINGLEFFNTYMSARNLIICSQISKEAKELLMKPLEKRLQKEIDENRFKNSLKPPRSGLK